jgi:NitT/TauT family transport system substrate-binding protein
MMIAAARRFGIALAAASCLMARAEAQDHVRIGVVNSLDSAILYVAAAKGYFKEEGLDAELVHFQSAAPIAVAVASGDVDFASTGLTAAFFNLASDGVLRVIGAGASERSQFPEIGFVESNQAYAAAVKSFGDLGGHSVAITQLGTPLHFNLARVLEKHGIPLSSVRVLALQSNPNVASAITGGTADAAVMSSANVFALVHPGNARLLGWVIDELPAAEADGAFTAKKLCDTRPETVKHFLAAFRHAERAWDAAFTDAAGKRQDQATADDMVALASQALSQPPAVIRLSIPYFDPQARVSIADIQDLIDWYSAQGMLKRHLDAKALVDFRYALQTPAS